MKPVMKLVNFIRARELNHREFRALPEDVVEEHAMNQVRRLSFGQILKRFLDLIEHVRTFLHPGD